MKYLLKAAVKTHTSVKGINDEIVRRDFIDDQNNIKLNCSKKITYVEGFGSFQKDRFGIMKKINQTEKKERKEEDTGQNNKNLICSKKLIYVDGVGFFKKDKFGIMKKINSSFLKI